MAFSAKNEKTGDPMLIHQIFEAHDGNRVLFHDHGTQITYGAFRRQVEQFRNYLHYVGVRPGENVGLYCKNCPEFVSAYFSVVSLGAVIVPLNRTLTPREVTFIAEDAGMKHIIAMQPLDLDQNIRQLLIPEIVEACQRREFPAAGAFAMKEDDPSTIIYTSGTTGKPKGAMLTHRNLVSNAEGISNALDVTGDDNFLCVLPMFHSFAWTATVADALLRGGQITVMESFQPKDAIKTIRDEGVTIVCGVPTMFGYYLSLGSPEAYEKVRLFVSGGASLPGEIISSFKDRFGIDITEGYGLSEASPVVTVNRIGRVRPGSIGLPLEHVTVKVVNPEGEAVPEGEVGELITQGPNVMLGYYNQPEATAAALKDGWLHTGDMARLDAEGFVYIVDRLKEIIIVSGLNVYPREVEEILYQYPGVQEAAVIGVPDKLRGEVPCAYIVLKPDAVYDRKDLMHHLHQNLANFKLPKDIVVMEALPKNATGKIMKRELKTQA